MKDGKEIARQVFTDRSRMLVGVKGLDRKPWIYPLGRATEIGGAFYWLCGKDTQLYGSLSLNPDAQVFLEEADGTVCRLTGKAVFSEEEGIVGGCLTAKREQAPVYPIAFCLKDARLIVCREGEETTYSLKTPDGVLTGIEMKKDREIRDRLAKILAERAARQVADREFQKLYDGALLVFGECAKNLWPSFSLMELESSLLYDTYDEREKYQAKAAEALGNVRIRQVEDLTYWLSEDRMRGLMDLSLR